MLLPLNLKPQFRKLGDISRSLLVRNTLYSTVWQFVRLAVQTFYLVLVVRFLGAQVYGDFAGMVALVTSIAPMAGAGLGVVLVKHVSRNPESLAVYWGRAFIVVAVTAPVLILFVLVISDVLFTGIYNRILLLIIACSEIFLVALINVCVSVFLGKESLGWSTFIHVILNMCRLVGFILLIITDMLDIGAFAWNYFFSTLLAGVIIVSLTKSRCGKIRWRLRGVHKDITEGISYASVGFLGIAHAEIDKTLMLKLSNPSDTGVYSAAARIVSAGSLPLVAYILSTVPKLFRMGEHGYVYTVRASLKLLCPAVAYGIIAGLGLYFCAPLFPLILGQDFENSAKLIRWLSPLPLLYGSSNLMLTVLTCTNLQWVRFWVEGTGFGLNILLNISFIPIYGITGPVISLLVSQSVLNLALVLIITIALKRKKLRNPEPSGKIDPKKGRKSDEHCHE